MVTGTRGNVHVECSVSLASVSNYASLKNKGNLEKITGSVLKQKPMTLSGMTDVNGKKTA